MSGEFGWKLEKLTPVAEYFKVSLDWLVYGKEANNEKTWREIAEKATKQRDEYRDALKTIQATMKEMIKVRVEA